MLLAVFTGAWVLGLVFAVEFAAAAGCELAAAVVRAEALAALASAGRASVAATSELEGEPLHEHRATRSAELTVMRIDMAGRGVGCRGTVAA
jgi:hypothetical protein